MTKLQWAQIGQRPYETGLDHGVLYLPNGTSVPWNGLTALEEDLGGDGTSPYFLDGVKFLDAQSTGEFSATLHAYTYPDEFLDLEGVEAMGNGLYVDDQNAKPFGLSYRTRIGNDVTSDLGYKLHICYNLLAVQDDVSHQSLSLDANVNEFSWKISGVPVDAPGYRPTAHVIIDSRYVYSKLLAELESMLYGSDTTEPRLPLLSELIPMVLDWSFIEITDNGDGTWTATGPDEFVYLTDPTTFTITEVDATYLDPDTYVIQTTYEPQGG